MLDFVEFLHVDGRLCERLLESGLGSNGPRNWVREELHHTHVGLIKTFFREAGCSPMATSIIADYFPEVSAS